MRKIKHEVFEKMLKGKCFLSLAWSGAELYDIVPGMGGVVKLYNGDIYLFDDWKDACSFYREMRTCDDCTEEELKEKLKDV